MALSIGTPFRRQVCVGPAGATLAMVLCRLLVCNGNWLRILCISFAGLGVGIDAFGAHRERFGGSFPILGINAFLRVPRYYQLGIVHTMNVSLFSS